MFSKLVARNSKRDRKSNGLYFTSMVISIVAFYIILALSNQDVMIFLKTIESDAVDKLFNIVPIFYVFTLFILFFLVYFSSSIQMDKRRHEFGIYLTLGMKRSKLFFMLFLEDLRNNLIALGIGLPLAITLSELVSLITGKWVGLYVIEHKFSLSFTAILFTIIGFMSVKLVAFMFLSAKIIRKELGQLMYHSPAQARRSLPKIIYIISGVLGIVLLAKAYHNGMSGKAWLSMSDMGITILLGSLGTILFFFGMRIPIEIIIRAGNKKKLHTYNFRQVQELVIQRSTVLAICSLLIFSALSFFGSGVAISSINTGNQTHTVDYTFRYKTSNGYEDIREEKVREELEKNGLISLFKDIIQIKVGNLEGTQDISFDAIKTELQNLKDSKDKESLIHQFDTYFHGNIISVSGYNKLRQLKGLEPLKLNKDEVAIYIHSEFLIGKEELNNIIKRKPQMKILNENVKVVKSVQSLPLVADRFVTLPIALIVSDDSFDAYVGNRYSTYVNGILNPHMIKEKGLMRSMLETNALLDKTSLGYESYLQNMGRELFFNISSSYLTIYLAIIFLVVANTIIGVQFLMGQRRSHKRYQTLIHLGATYNTLCKSSRKQILWYFGLPVVMAIINSFFGIRSLFMGILPSTAKENILQESVIATLMILLLFIFEVIYIGVVNRNSNRYLLSLMEPKREN